MARPHGSKKNGWKFLNDSELRRFMDTLNRRGSLRDQCMMQLTLYLGLRVSELVKLRKDDLNPESKEIYIKAVKSGRDRSYSEIEAKLWRKLIRYLNKAKPEDRIFPLTPQQAKNIFKKYSQLANLRSDLSIHSLRHTAAIQMVRQNQSPVRVMLWLRHRSIASSQKYFEQVEFENEAVMMNAVMRNWL